MKRQLKLLVVLFTMLTMFSIGSVRAEAAGESLTILVPRGGRISLALTAGTSLKNAKWTSSNKTVATVSTEGVVSGKSNGTTVITAAYGTTKKSVKVLVAPEVSAVRLNKNSAAIYVGKSITLTARLTPADAKSQIVWESSDASVAVVSNGVVTGKKAGTATITAYAGAKKVSCKVTVSKLTTATYTMEGLIKNAADGSVVSDVTVVFRKGYNKKSGTVYKQVKSNSQGKYSVKLTEGDYTLQAGKTGWITCYLNVHCYKKTGTDTNYQTVSITKKLKATQYRVVLTWSASPSDLDAHLVGYMNGNENCHVYFSNKNAYYNNELLANLDVDNRNSYGPETVTINLNVLPGESYRYFIHDYTNRNLNNSNELARSGAKVVLYKGNSQIATYAVPTKSGTLWHVFDIVGGTVKKVNVMGYESSPESIR